MDENELDEKIADEIADEIAEVAAEIIEEKAVEAEIADAAFKAMLDAMINSEEYRQRMEFETRVFDAINEIRNGLEECQRNLEILQSTTMQLSLTTTALETAMSLIPSISNPPSEVVEDLENLTEEVTEIQEVISPENPPEPETPTGPTLRKRLRRLL